MMKLFLFLGISIFLLTPNGAAQDYDQDEVLKPIYQIFEGMNKSDSSIVSAAFYSGSVVMQTAYLKEGKSTLHEGSLEGFLKAIGTPKDQVWEEKVWDFKIQVDKPLAQVWCQYAFYVDNTFHHCGVDAFQLLNTESGWKIFSVVDTRQTENCPEPPE